MHRDSTFIVGNETKAYTLKLQTDGHDYHILTNAVKMIKNVPGMICELGTRMGGSLSYIVQSLIENEDFNRNMVTVDPYGNIEYIDSDTAVCRYDYTNDMRAKALIAINAYSLEKPVNIVSMIMEDTEFFNRYSDGVPFYNNYKVLETKYALVYFDGPHSRDAVQKEVEFFHPRSQIGTLWIFDDPYVYDHDSVESWMLARGWQVHEKSQFKGSLLKASYIYVGQ